MTLRTRRQPLTTAALTLLAALTITGCASPRHRAPVEDRGIGAKPVARADSGVVVAPAEPAPEAPEPVKVPTYTVRPGDTLIRIGLETGQNWRDIARWNSLDNANVLEVGQVLRVGPGAAEVVAAGPKPVAPAGRIEAKPLDAPASGAATAPPNGAPSSPPAAPVAKESEDGIQWMWPASGALLAGFDEAKNKGLGIGGQSGDPVLAAADGRVVYAGSGLRGYGNLVIVKHNSNFLSAYAHNQTLLVKEDQAVKRGQKIAEMGATDSDRVKLHFEIRRQGKPVDPAKLLPPR